MTQGKKKSFQWELSHAEKHVILFMTLNSHGRLIFESVSWYKIWDIFFIFRKKTKHFSIFMTKYEFSVLHFHFFCTSLYAYAFEVIVSFKKWMQHHISFVNIFEGKTLTDTFRSEIFPYVFVEDFFKIKFYNLS